MSFDNSSTDSSGQSQKRNRQSRVCENQHQHNNFLATLPHKQCDDSCCRRCASTIEQTVSNQLQKLLTGRDLAQEMQQLGIDGRLSCLPLTASNYRFLKHQFRIVQDYLSEHDSRNIGTRWGAVFHLRLIDARIRNARKSSTWEFQWQSVSSNRTSDCCCHRLLREQH